MILLLSNERDLTTDYVVLELQRRNVAFLRLNGEKLSEASVTFSPNQADWKIVSDGMPLLGSAVHAAYFRRPGVPVAPQSVMAPDEQQYCEQEWLSILHSLYSAIGDRWLNAPDKIAMAEDKPRQLAIAAAMSFDLPETLITNDPVAARSFIEGGPTIGKTLRAGLLRNEDSGEERVIFTNRIDVTDDDFAEGLRTAPIILQREITKLLDIRVTVVDDTVMAASIDSQIKLETTVDWRRGSHTDLPHHSHDLPPEISQKCKAITAALGLRFAAIDLILDQENKYWFLEANPNGQWAWIEARTGLPIAARIVDALLNGPPQPLPRGA